HGAPAPQGRAALDRGLRLHAVEPGRAARPAVLRTAPGSRMRARRGRRSVAACDRARGAGALARGGRAGGGRGRGRARGPRLPARARLSAEPMPASEVAAWIRGWPGPGDVLAAA